MDAAFCRMDMASGLDSSSPSNCHELLAGAAEAGPDYGEKARLSTLTTGWAYTDILRMAESTAGAG